LSIIDAVLLAIVQGLTEFLPVSSSGHLVLGRQLLGVANTGDVAFEVVVHFGTFLAVLLVFWSDIKSLLASLLKGLRHPGQLKTIYHTDAQFYLASMMIIGMIPAGIVGILFQDQLEALFANPKLVAGMLILTGVFLFLTKWVKAPHNELNPGRSFLIGAAQAFAIIPGISRSGSTISTAMYLGIERIQAARFSFIMVLPLIFGAMLLQAFKMDDAGLTALRFEILATGLIVSFLVGYAALKWLMGTLERGRFHWFGYYCLLVGGVGLIFA